MIRQTKHDGEPAVLLKRTVKGRERGFNKPVVITRLLVKHGQRKDVVAA